jgi:SAM-dependent methyltransferase
VSPRPTAEAIKDHYPADFYWKFEGGKTFTPADLLELRRLQIESKYAYVADLPVGKLLDVGAMKGEFVRTLISRGWRAEGLEFNSTAPNLFSVPMRYGEFLELEYEEESFDCITMWAVLEHVYAPRLYLQKAVRLLKPGGRFICLVTNFNSLQARWLKLDDFPRHLTLFTKSALAKLLHDVGLRPGPMVTDQSIFGGSLYGGLVQLAKFAGGYSMDELHFERRCADPLAFCCKWRGQPSIAMRWLSRADAVASRPIEKLLDYTKNGFILTTIAHKPVP